MRKGLLATVLGMVLMAPGISWGGDCYGVAVFNVTPPTSTGDLVKFSSSTGAVISRVPLTLPGETVLKAQGITRHPTTGTYYAIVQLEGQSFGRDLVTVDVDTGICAYVGFTGDKFASIAFDGSGTLYGVTGDGADFLLPPSTLFTLSLADATPTFVMALGNGGDGEVIAYNPDDGLMYHMSGRLSVNVGRIFESINLTTLEVTPITLTGVSENEEALGMKYVGGGNFIYSNLTAELVQVTTAGVETLIADSTAFGEFLRGLAPAEIVAVPGASRLGLWLTGVLLLVAIGVVVGLEVVLRPH